MFLCYTVRPDGVKVDIPEVTTFNTSRPSHKMPKLSLKNNESVSVFGTIFGLVNIYSMFLFLFASFLNPIKLFISLSFTEDMTDGQTKVGFEMS